MDGMFATALRLLDKIEDLNPNFEGISFYEKILISQCK